MMMSEKKRPVRIVLEITAALAIVGAAAVLLGGHLEKLVLFLLLSLFVMLFSLKYGIFAGIATFGLAVAFQIGLGLYRSEDVVLFFVSRNFMFETTFLAAVAGIAGVFSMNRKDRFADISERHDHLVKEKQELQETVKVLEESRQELKRRLLEHDSHLGTMYELFKAINHRHPEIVLDRALDVMKEHFGAKDAAVYYVDKTKSVLRLKVDTTGRSGIYRTTIREEKPPVLRKALAEEFPQFRSAEDPADAPFLAGPVKVSGEIRFMLVAGPLPFDAVSSQQFDLFVWFVKWLGERMESADEWMESNGERMHPGTAIYYSTEVPFLRQLCENRQKKYGVPYTYSEIPADGLSIYEVQEAVGKRVRELVKVDIVAFDEKRKVVHLLLPNTNKEEEQLVLERVQQGIKHWKEGILL
ncbi:hypothetical protein ACFFIY_08400 [Bhargavaea ullalensis]|uniref:GAF domain-containing protein n=1 Tax=Bhargavaea ullalensis TaxID=1265685 RepID=A0ABV2GED0_9BACL